MLDFRRALLSCGFGAALVLLTVVAPAHGQAMPEEERACLALRRLPHLTILLAEIVEATDATPPYCYVQGLIAPAIRFHVQLPLRSGWNQRLLVWGDGGKDGDLDFADHRLAQGYAVANSNTGHDNGAEPGASFGFNNRQAEIDFGYRAVHVTTNAAKSLVKAYYQRDPEYSYFEGCSTGGKQALTEAQRFPDDFDGIVGGAPVLHYQLTNVGHVWVMQKVFGNRFAGNLAYDKDGDGVPESLTKLTTLEKAVLAKCDARDGIRDGVIDDPPSCDFDPARDLAKQMCRGDVNADDCFTRAQIQTIQDIYSGPYDSAGRSILKGKALGSEWTWADALVPHARNSMFPSRLGISADHLNYLFYERDPGVPASKRNDPTRALNRKKIPPEWGWWEFNMNDVREGRGDLMMSITDAADPDLKAYLLENRGKLILYHGWGDPAPPPEPTLDYYRAVVRTTFGGDVQRARDNARLFMVPGMGHCSGGPGPNEWDKLEALVEWVEQGKAPDFVVATHRTNGRVDNERPICAYPLRAVYTGPAGGENDPANWVARNFACRDR